MANPTNTDDVIDSRDVIERASELSNLVEDNPNNLGYDERHELKALMDLSKEAEGYAADWQHGETLIRDNYFEQYAEELAEDLGMIIKQEKWPFMHIDWEAAADELKQNYTAVDFDGVTYWIR